MIAPYTHSLLVQGLMRWAAREVLGRDIPVETKYLGLRELADKPRYVQLDFETWRETARCSEYLNRLRLWEEGAGKAVIPYRMKLREQGDR